MDFEAKSVSYNFIRLHLNYKSNTNNFINFVEIIAVFVEPPGAKTHHQKIRAGVYGRKSDSVERVVTQSADINRMGVAPHSK
jgi:hypothetical protein